MLSMPVFDAASSSRRSTKRPASISVHAAQMPQGVGVTPGDAVEALREDARDRRLADAARARQQVRVVQPAAREGVGERSDDVRLTGQFRERARAPFARQNLVTHFTRVVPYAARELLLAAWTRQAGPSLRSG
jgi:hypothetical protein